MERAAGYVIVASLAVVCATAILVLSPALRSAMGIEPAAIGYSVGEYVDLPLGELDSPGLSAAIFIRATCAACEASLPLLRQLFADEQVRASVLVVIGKSARPEDRQFARDAGATDAQILSADFSRLRLSRVPTLLVWDTTKKIILVRSGSLSIDDLEAARRMLITYPTP